MTNITYDPEVRILDIRLSKAKIVDSDSQGDCIFDYDAKGNIVNIEILLDFDLEELINKSKKKSK